MILLLFDIDSRVAILFLHLSHEQTLHELSEVSGFWWTLQFQGPTDPESLDSDLCVDPELVEQVELDVDGEDGGRSDQRQGQVEDLQRGRKRSIRQTSNTHGYKPANM